MWNSNPRAGEAIVRGIETQLGIRKWVVELFTSGERTVRGSGGTMLHTAEVSGKVRGLGGGRLVLEAWSL